MDPITLTDEQITALEDIIDMLDDDDVNIHNFTSPEQVVEYIFDSLVEAVERPGSWERQLLSPLFGI